MSPVKNSVLEYNYINRSQYTDLIAIKINRDKIIIKNILEP